MAEHGEDSKASTISRRKKESAPFVEVICDRTKKSWRFAVGTEAKFAVKMINSKLDSRFPPPPGTHIEAVKDGEDPVIFGPNAVLVNYGDGWSLRTATDSAGFGRAKQDNMVKGEGYHPPSKGLDHQRNKRTLYFGKILLAFIFIFLLGAIFTLILESLPKLAESRQHSNETK